MSTKIQWCDETINPIQSVIKGKSGRGYHCTKVKAGCKNCYAERINNRFGNKLPYIHYNKQSAKVLKTHARRLLKFELVYSQLEKPAKWKKPKRIFVQSMSDLFHENVPNEILEEIFSFMCGRGIKHTYILLTKRPQDMLEWIDDYCGNTVFNNLWLGVSISTQKDADEMIPILLQIPAKVRFVSVEPMLETINLTVVPVMKSLTRGEGIYNYLTGSVRVEKPDRILTGGQKIDWVICGAETGLGARPYRVGWIRSIKNQCRESGMPFFLKNPATIDGIEYKQFPRENFKTIKGICIKCFKDSQLLTIDSRLCPKCNDNKFIIGNNIACS